MLDFTRILVELNKHRVDYMVVGGIAVNLHGIPRMTYDLDLMVKLVDSNLKKFLKLMKEWDYKPKIPVDIMDFAMEEKRKEWIEEKNMKAFSLRNDKATIKEIDIIIDSPVSYEEAKESSKNIELHNTLIPVIGIGELIRMKEVVDRKQDESDIRYLKKKLEEE